MKKRIITVSAIILIVVFVGVYFVFFWQKTCNDEKCFDDMAKKCKSAVYISEKNENVFVYRIKHRYGDYCELNVKVEKINDVELKNLFLNKEMRCLIPKEKFSMEFLSLSNSLDYCSGPLKEAMYELIIQRMYDLSVKQIGDVVVEVEELIK